MKKAPLLLVIFFSVKVCAQVTFEPGFLINNNGERIDCLIQDEGWWNNPEAFTYRLTFRVRKIS